MSKGAGFSRLVHLQSNFSTPKNKRSQAENGRNFLRCVPSKYPNTWLASPLSGTLSLNENHLINWNEFYRFLTLGTILTQLK